MKLTDELTRNLRRNIFINKVKDVPSFIELIETIFRTIIGKTQLTSFFYRFDRSLAIDIVKNDSMFDFVIRLRNIKSGPQMFIEDLYTLLYMFFVSFEIIDVSTFSEKDCHYDVTLKIKFNVEESQGPLVKDTLSKIKELKDLLNQMRLKSQANRNNKKPVEDIFITKI